MKNLYRPSRRREQDVRSRGRRGRGILQALERVFPAALVLVLLVGAGAAGRTFLLPWIDARVRGSEFFALEQVQIRGIRNLTEDQVLEAAGLVFGQNILATDLGKVRERLLAHPLVRNAAVRRLLPADVVIEIEERVPAVELRAGGRYIIDAEGHIMTAAREDLPLELPCISGLRVTDGRVRAEDLDDLAEGLWIASVIAEVGFPPSGQVECLDMGSESDALIVTARGGPLVHLGRGDVRERLRRWMLVAGDMASRWDRVEYVDLRAEGLVVTKPVLPPPQEEGKGEEG